MRRIIPFLLLQLAFLNIHAQTDTEFWFAAPEVTALHGDSPIILRINAMDQPCQVTISQPANPLFNDINLELAAKSTESVDLTAWIDIIETKPFDQVLNYGLLIRATDSVQVYYEVNATNNAEIFSLKGRIALGNQFYIPTQTYLGNSPEINGKSGFVIIASEDNTTVNITPNKDIVGHSAGVPYSVMLDRGQTYSATPLDPDPADHLMGSRVISDKPVAITLYDDAIIGDQYGSNSVDLGGDQLVPVSSLGYRYIIVQGFLNHPFDKFYFLGTSDSTTIYVNGVYWGLFLTAGDSNIYNMGYEKAVYVESSAPIYILHMSGVNTEMGLSLIPPLDCSGSEYYSFVRTDSSPVYINLLVQQGGENSFLVNGNAGVIPPASFSEVPGTQGEWLYTQLELDESAVPPGIASLISNSVVEFSLGFFHGQGGSGGRYGYFSNSVSYEISILADHSYYCEGEDLILTAEVIPGITYEWSGPNGFNYTGPEVVINSLTPGEAGYYILHGLILHMPLNGDVNDISGNNNQGINHGATPSTDRKGNANGAMHFNGTDSWIEVPNSPSIQSPEQALSVSSWIRAESEAIYFICKVNGPSYNQYQFRTGINLLSKQYFLGINGADYCWEDTILADLALNEWFLFTITYDGSEIKFYFNGELSNTYLHSQLINPNSERLEIGRDAHGPIEWMMGDLDDLRIYNVALTAEQVACIYYENCIDLVLDANLSDETICNNDHSELEIINAQTSVSYQLLKDGSVYGSPQTGNLDTLVFPISNILETSTFKVVATDLNTGCSITLDSVFTVEVLSPEVEALVITDSDYAPAAASLSSTSRDAVVFEWYQDGNLIATTEQAQVDLPAPGEYTFVLVAGSGPPANCSDSDTVRITLQVPVNVVLEIPNAFTPNNDGINDFFEITTEGITKSDVWIKDRWGLLIAEFDGQTGHWDGLNGSGKEAPAGPYYFHVEAIDYAGKTMEESGVVYLVREMIELSPNPAVQQIMINMKGCLPGERTLQISSVQGVSFFQESFSDEIFKVDISKIKPGIYFVKISNGKDQQYLKFVKE